MTRLIWPAIALLAIIAGYLRAPAVAEAIAHGVQDVFVTVYDSSQFDHTTGKWEVGDNGLWSKVKK